MRIDLTDLDRLESFAEALERLFWCLMVVAFFAAILGSAGTGLFLLILGSLAFVVRAGFEDFTRSRRDRSEPKDPGKKTKPERKPKAKPDPTPAAEPGITVYRTKRPRRSKPAV